MPTKKQALRGVIQVLEGFERAGVAYTGKPRKRQAAPPVDEVQPQPLAATTAVEPPPAAVKKPPATVEPVSLLAEATGILPPEARLPALNTVREAVRGCTRCGELCSTRTQTVFGSGNPNARLVFMGEAPGADEDRQGEPFVGRAGQLLTDIIEKGCKLPRSEVYILNVLKCRPPSNRPPQPDEVANCRNYFERQFEIIRPDFICCLGLHASQALLNVTTSIGKLRGRFHEYRGAEVICTYHPAYLLRNPAAKRDVWEDIQKLMQKFRGE